MKIRPVGSKSSIQTNEGTDRQTRRQTDMTKLVVTLHSFANSPKIADFTRFAVAPPFGGGGGGGGGGVVPCTHWLGVKNVRPTQ